MTLLRDMLWVSNKTTLSLIQTVIIDQAELLSVSRITSVL